MPFAAASCCILHGLIRSEWSLLTGYNNLGRLFALAPRQWSCLNAAWYGIFTEATLSYMMLRLIVDAKL